MINQFKQFQINTGKLDKVLGGTKPMWAGKPDKTNWATETVLDENGEEEIEYIAPWEDYEGGRKQYMLDLAAAEEIAP